MVGEVYARRPGISLLSINSLLGKCMLGEVGKYMYARRNEYFLSLSRQPYNVYQLSQQQYCRYINDNSKKFWIENTIQLSLVCILYTAPTV